MMPAMIALTTLLLFACSPALDGSWTGPLDCGRGTVPVDMALDLAAASGGGFDGAGLILFTQADGTDREITFEVFADVAGGLPFLTRVHGVSIELDSCRYDGQQDDCYGISDAAIDTRDDVLTGDMDGFLQSWDCAFELRR